ncbi:translin-associated factor X-interacting protein 1 isoform X1 [Alligator mississippiensis]|uniref:translin-associated factor X-interacting protein 1 isoform X1 n=1 Tax=Alligator mississippiensis TaxID=8496 RepID=UPI000906FC65|nr:translin-associated factor X-interacting protein 1 isoform X1 [Alligator mississippiensis]XP_019344521.1 translin-associated factor X-interacting protein 1 isoform X1 [Alligator mississippiensis]
MAWPRGPSRGESLPPPTKSSSYQSQPRSLKCIHSGKWKTLPFQFSAGSHLSTWPAYASGQAVLQNSQPCCDPEKRSSEQASLTIAKPRYLEQMESYLREEVQALDLTKDNAQELKLQVPKGKVHGKRRHLWPLLEENKLCMPYREIFEFFIEAFKTYKPLLSAIKNEYEITLDVQREKIRALEPLKSMFATVSDKCTQKISALKKEENAKIKTLMKEKLYLLKLIDKMKEEKASLQAQVNKLQKNVAEEYLHYRNECDARKLLLADLNEMRSQQLEMTLHQTQDIKSEDIVKLTLALKIARRDLTKAQVELNTMKADYGDVVPRRDFESQEKKYSDLCQQTETLQKDFDQLQKEYDTLLEVHGETVEERNRFYNELQQVLRSSTPRPDWAKCAGVVPGGVDRWRFLAEGKTSNQLVDLLLEEMGAAVLREKDFFPGLGKGDKVPVYLRYEGQVKNRKLNKKNVVNILKDLWKERISAHQQTGWQSSLPEFFLSYLQKRYGDASAFEMAYSIYESVKLYRSNHVMNLSYDILTGKVDEGVYHGLNQMLSNLLKELTAIDSSNSGAVTSKQFNLALRAAFPLKSNEHVQELIEASKCKAESAEDLIFYTALFNEDAEGNTEPFVVKVWNQYVAEKQDYLRELQNELGHVIEVKVDDLKTALYAIDPTIDDLTMDNYIYLAYQVPKEELEQAVPLPLETIIEKLLAGDIRRAGPLPEEASRPAPEEGEPRDYDYY